MNSYFFTIKLKSQKGFTLVELSIVIVIIGLIVAGVVGGQTLVKQAKLRSVIADVYKVQTALNAFYLEYAALPGDMPNASDFWTGAYDGNGNNRIDQGANTETLAVWTHLHLSEILLQQGTNENRPSPIAGTRYLHWYHPAGVYGKVANSLNMLGTSGGGPWPGALVAKDTITIDKKMDDGLADSGVMRSAKGLGRPADQCTQGANQYNATSAVYNLTDTTQQACWIMFFIWPK